MSIQIEKIHGSTISVHPKGKCLQKIRTKHFKRLIPEDQAWCLYYTLKDQLPWADGIKGRKAVHYSMGMLPELDDLILNCIKQTCLKQENDQETILGVYINYYRDGNDFTPNHIHKLQKQLIISLGETRTLTVSNKDYNMENGDVAIFGSSTHGVPKNSSITKVESVSLYLWIMVLLDSNKIYE